MKQANSPANAICETTQGRMAARGVLWTFVLSLAAAMVAGAIPASAQTVTLADALKLALRADNPTLRQQDDNVARAAGRSQEASGAFDWTTNVQGGTQLFYVPTAANGYLTNHTSTVTSYFYSVNIGRRFRNGIEVAPGVTAYPGSGATPAQTAGLTQLRPALQLKIPILQGFGGGAADAAERGAFDALRSARENRTFAAGQFAQGVAITFWRCVADDQILKETEDADSHASAYGASLAALARKGVLEPTVVQQWAANNAVQHLNIGRAQDEAQRCRRDLAYAMTGDATPPWPAPVGELPRIEDFGAALDRLRENELITLALDRRLDLKALNENIQAAHENVRSAQDSAKPTLDVHLDPERSYVTFTKSFENNIARGRQAEAAGAEDQARMTLRQTEDQARDQVSDAIANLKRSASDWAALDAAEKQMETVIGDAQKRAQFGEINWSDFLTAQNQLTQLRQQVINARLAFADGLATLRLVTGTIDPGRPMSIADDLVRLPTP